MKKKNRMLGLLLAFALLTGNLYPVPIVRAEEETQVQQTVVQQEQQVEGAEKQEEETEPEEEVSKIPEQQETEENTETVEEYSLDEEEPEIEEQAEIEEVPQSITGNYLGVKTEAKVYSDFENDIWLQYQQKEMQVGDTASLRPWRAEQIVTNTVANDVARPNFRFEIIAGDSISLDTGVSSEKAVVKAVKPGTSIVKVTYDALDYKGEHWDGISPVNTAYAVYTVGETGTAVIGTNDAFKNWRHYDTIYYKNGSTVPYRFTVNTQNAASIKVTCNGLVIAGSGNYYTANLENRSNIIGIETTDADGNVKSMWRVIDARFIEVNVANKTNPEQPLNAGDTATVSFRGITMPVYKLATIYNPCSTSIWGGKSTRVQYHNAKLGDFEGKCNQWDLARKNSFDVTFAENGEYVFTSEKGIYCEWWGSPLGADITANGSGEPNLNAPVLKDNFSKLPDFTISVGEGEGGGEVTPEEPDTPEEPEEPEEPIVPETPGQTEKPQQPEKPEFPAKPDIPAILEKTKPSGALGSVVRSLQAGGRPMPAKKESNTVDAKMEGSIVSKAQVEQIAGKDKNLRMRGKMEDGTEYTMILNGKDIKTPEDINATVTRKSMYEEEIGLLAPEPEIFVFENEGEFPGEMMTELSVDKEDGTYLLFRYDPENEKAVYVQKVTVKKGKVKFLVSEGGSYFIDKMAKVKTVPELKEAEMKKEPKQKAEEPKAVKAQSFAGDTNKTSHQPLYIFLGSAAAAGIFMTGYLTGRKKKGK